MIDVTATSRPIQMRQEVTCVTHLAYGSAQPCKPHGKREEDRECEVHEQRRWEGFVDANDRKALTNENRSTDSRQYAEHPRWKERPENVLRRCIVAARQRYWRCARYCSRPLPSAHFSL